ncbi:hypothetical protein F5Y19DRAFT_478574 [Xylariaceae sp. FL1651]|nr:hypothetical protein F5Y19DRAFT_478574 [Xylariaceae sp. FL1651]
MSSSKPGGEKSKQQQVLFIPKTLRWCPMPAPLDKDANRLPTVLKTPDFPVPCRRCLQDSQVGDEMLLLSYDPFLGDSPYRCASPIFLHSKPSCELAASPTALPEQQRGRLLSVRAYDGKHMMVDADVVDGNKVVEVCQRMLEEEGSSAEYCHVHYAMQGCFAVRVDKASAAN